MNSFFNQSRLHYSVVVTAIALAVLFLYLFGIQGMLKSAPFGDDFSVFYRAGDFFLKGIDPWQTLSDSGTPFSYPPHVLPLLHFYNVFSFQTALTIHTALNFVSVVAIAAVSNRWFIGIRDIRDVSPAQLLALLLLLANPYTATSIHQGQFALPIAAAVFLSWDYLHRGRWMLSGFFLCLATIKPQLSALCIIWLILSFKLRPLFVGGMFSALLLIPGAVTFGLVDIFQSWLWSLGEYSKTPINAPGSPYVVGVDSLLAAHGISGTGVFLRILALLSIVILYWKRALFDNVQIIYLFFTISLTLIYGHDYDYAAIVGIFSYCLYLVLTNPTLKRVAVMSVLFLLFFIPQRLIRDYEIVILQHLRTLLLPLCCYFVFLLRQQEQKSS